MKKYAIIVAGGSGHRMKSSIPKQFLILGKYPVLMHSINAFFNYDTGIEIILVLPQVHIQSWKDLCVQFNFTVKHKIVEGGETRFQSVKNALAEISNESLVAIHDGVRPLVSLNTINRCFIVAEKLGNAVPAIAISESVRRCNDTDNCAVDRTQYRIIQTPQVFGGKLLLDAYCQNYDSSFTDDAGVVESNGHKIHIVEGNKENIKITTPHDMAVANTLLGLL